MQFLIHNIDYFLGFIIYSFLGWIVESAGRTMLEKRGFVNSGFLHNPFIPIYGVGAIIIILLNQPLLPIALPLRILIFTIICTALEYLTGLAFEAIFKIKLWDYTKQKFNIHGRICLFNSFLWAILIGFFILLIRPNVDRLIIGRLAFEAKYYIALVLLAVILFDTLISTLELKSTALFLNQLLVKYNSLTVSMMGSLSKKIRNRFFHIFPNIEKIFTGRFMLGFLDLFKVRQREPELRRISQIINQPPLVQAAMDPAYVDAVQDLLAHDVVKQMTEYPHHDQTTLAHSLVVSQVSFQLAKKFKADARSTARGALLHDLFLYSWRDHQGISHVVNHPKIALANAQKHFQLNEVETDIILKHMWPLCRRFFRYREAFIVSMVDKIVATKEAIAMLNQFINQKMN